MPISTGKKRPSSTISVLSQRSDEFPRLSTARLSDRVHFEVLHVLAEGDQVLIHWTASGTHAERLATLTGETIPPTRRRVRVSGALLTKVRDGKVVRLWGYLDQLSVLAQLGISEQPGLFLSPDGF